MNTTHTAPNAAAKARPTYRWYDVAITGSNDVFPSVNETDRQYATSAARAATASRRAWSAENCAIGTRGLKFKARLADL